MRKNNMTKFFGSLKTGISKHSPEILIGIGIAGMISSTILAVKATPKALALINKEISHANLELQNEADKNGETKYCPISKLKPKDVVKVAWRCYIPSAVISTTSIICLIGASSVNNKRNAVLATAYKLSEAAFTEYKEKVVETIGEKKEHLIKEKVHQEELKNNPVSHHDVIITGGGDTLCYDHYSGVYFKSDIDKIKKAVNELNKKILTYDYASLNDLYDELGIRNTGIGSKLGWNSQDKLIELDFSSQLSEDGTPCIVIDYKVPPIYNFDRSW